MFATRWVFDIKVANKFAPTVGLIESRTDGGSTLNFPIMLSASKIHQALRDHGITHVVGLTDNLCLALFQFLIDDPGIEVINVSREGEAFALASGLYLGGKKPIVLIQNTGFLEL